MMNACLPARGFAYPEGLGKPKRVHRRGVASVISRADKAFLVVTLEIGLVVLCGIRDEIFALRGDDSGEGG